ncbi:MAG TPA: SDR family oxidoreductase [Rhodocyclaceae bacterium]|nr:SDR family oxidoreductase [Rhodocyclaceae bacterium]
MTVNTISPGCAGTKVVTATPQKVPYSKMAPQSQQVRLGRPKEVAGLVAYLALDEVASVTGAHISMNGRRGIT